jgi:TorA maturation chaperone TorD
MSIELRRALSAEYGRLDAIHDMGYFPPFPGFEAEYCAAFMEHTRREVAGWISSYVDPENWGQY